MANPSKKTGGSRSGKGSDKGRLTVVDSRGTRQRFLRGMVTHDLVQRGLSFDQAYAAAHAIRDQLVDRDEVTTAEIRELIQQHLEEVFGPEGAAGFPPVMLESAAIHVVTGSQRQPFSRGLLARSILAAGLDIDRAYRVVGRLEQSLQQDSLQQDSDAVTVPV